MSSRAAAATSGMKTGQHPTVVQCALRLSAQPGGRSLSHPVEVGGLPLLGNFTSKPIVRCQQPLLPANPPQKGRRQAGGGPGSERLLSGSVNSQQAISVLKGKSEFYLAL